MVLKGQECLLTRDLIVTSTLRFGGCRIYYKMHYLYDIYSHDCLTLIHVYIKLFFVTAALRIFVLFLITANVG